MKTNYRISIMAAIVAALTIAGTASAQSQLVAENGIAASPKVRAQINQRAPAPALAVASTVHKCALCTDSLITVVDKATKGPNHLVTKAFRHNCAGCDTKLVTEGTGKAKKDVAIHRCNAEVKPLCCAMN
jgi:hypothetical protein